jgi:mRNA-degrading endonuclease toxin of MazEF toxin-antitoxin module
LIGTVPILSTVLGPPEDSIAVAYQIRTIPKAALKTKVRMLSETELADLEAARTFSPLLFETS